MPEKKENIALLGTIAIFIVIVSIFMRASRWAVISRDNEPRAGNSVKSGQSRIPDNSFFQTQNGVKTERSIANDGAENVRRKNPEDRFAAVSAKAFLVGDVNTGKIYFERDSKKRMPVASISKLITAVVATDTMFPETVVEITPKEAEVPPDESDIKAGERFTLHELLHPLLLDSSNIAAEAIASSSDRGKFLESMLSYAWEVGMSQAYFEDPSGISPYNTASAVDIFALAKYLVKFRPDILTLTATVRSQLATTSDHGSHDFKNIHPFVADLRFVGGKTGRTPEAGETMLTILTINGKPTAFIVMGSSFGSRENDTRILLEYLNE